tara:strand:+ start:1521 stop:2216 length:696 start_codon:yes stop_codon:yes gene_type:complete
MYRSKKYTEDSSKYDKYKEYNLDEAVDLLVSFNKAKFDESVDISVNLGVDPKHADQIVRGTVSLPNGTGKAVKVVVISKDDSQNKASLEEGALEAGSDEILEKIKKGWVDFDILIASPDMMPQLSKHGRVLGPRGLMPNPKVGTVTNDIAKAVKEVIAGKVEYRVDKNGIINVSIGRRSFAKEKLMENIKVCMDSILKAKPSAVKGTYFQKFTLSTTMGPGIRVIKSDFIN